MQYKAVVIGATGLVGRHLVQYLIEDSNCVEVRMLVRRDVVIPHSKVKSFIIDFDNLKDYETYIHGDVLFSCLGTTKAQAKSPENQYLVDYTYQCRAAECASKNGIEHYVLVSSPYANIDSGNYYRRMKAELERDTAKLPFKKVTFLKPNGLIGEREKPRKLEMYAIRAFTFLSTYVKSWRTYKPIEGRQVAKAMIKSYYKSLERQERVIELNRNEVLEVV